MNESEKINKSVVISYASILFSMVSGLLYTPWLIRNLGSSDYALYTIAISVMSYFIIDFGIGASITRFIARYKAEKKEYKINRLLGISLKLYLIIDVIAFIGLVVVYFFLNNIYQGLTPEELERLKVVFGITAGMIVFCIPFVPINGVFIAFGRVYDVKKFDLIQKALTILLICVSIFLGYGLFAVTLINAATTVLINFIKLVVIHKSEKVTPELRARDKSITRELLTFSGWVAIAMIADKFFLAFEPTLLGIFSDSAQISVFAVAASMEGYVLTFADGLNGIFLPRVTNMVVQKKSPAEMTALMIRVGRIQMAIVSAFIIGIITQGSDFIPIWFGKEYTQSYMAVVIVLLPCFIHLTESIAIEMIYATNNVRYRALAYTVSSVTNMVLTAILAPRYGAFGAAVGIAVGFCLGHELILNIVYRRVLGLDIKSFFLNCHLRALPAIAAMLAIGFGISALIPAETKWEILFRCGICGVLFVIIIVFLFLNKEEKGYIKKIFTGIVGKFR